MKTKGKILLKSRLIKNKFSTSEVEEILALEDKVLDKLALIGSDEKLGEMSRCLLNESQDRYSNKDKTLSVYRGLKKTLSPEDYEAGLELLKTVPDDFHMRLIFQALNSEILRTNNLSLEAIYLISMASNELKGTIAFDAIKNPSLINLGVAKDIASLIINENINREEVLDNILVLLDTEDKKRQCYSTLRYIKSSLRVFVSHPDDSIKDMAKDIDNTIIELLNLVSPNEKEKITPSLNIPDYYGGLKTKSLTLDHFKAGIKRRRR